MAAAWKADTQCPEVTGSCLAAPHRAGFDNTGTASLKVEAGVAPGPPITFLLTQENVSITIAAMIIEDTLEDTDMRFLTERFQEAIQSNKRTVNLLAAVEKRLTRLDEKFEYPSKTLTPEEYRAKRKLLGTQEEVAKLLGVARRTINRRENGGAEISFEATLAILSVKKP